MTQIVIAGRRFTRGEILSAKKWWNKYGRLLMKKQAQIKIPAGQVNRLAVHPHERHWNHIDSGILLGRNWNQLNGGEKERIVQTYMSNFEVAGYEIDEGFHREKKPPERSRRRKMRSAPVLKRSDGDGRSST